MNAKDERRLEDRLGEALRSAAGTVPDQVVRPHPAWSDSRPARQRRTWAVVVVAAAAVAAAVALPSLLPEDDKSAVAGNGAATCASPPPITLPAPTIPQRKPSGQEEPWLARLPFGPPPKVPYTLTAAPGSAGFLQDGSLRVPLPAGR